ncbi:hypothetical protein [Amycolatopsis sp. cmx-4-68]|uniref:hypothetical protein n=1 Tax=Amycolatopsis sp. cmx-4-68 TaxID=2790938 RepID=UPI00397E4A95
MYDTSDPRSALPTTNSPAPATTELGEPQLIALRSTEPTFVSAAGSRVWHVRTATFLVIYYELTAHDTVALLPATGDRVVMVPHEGEVVTVEIDDVTAGDSSATVGSASVMVVPGAARITARTAATVIETASYKDLGPTPPAVNEHAYAEPMPRVAESAARRVNGLQGAITVYPLKDFEPSPDRFGRIFCSSNMMVNLLEVEHGPRDTARLSPHLHDDFEQCSITTRGTYVYHWRAPWTPDLGSWREDLHPSVDSPAITLIPPGVIHTANSTTGGENQMIDVFSPPRGDFISKGWVLNSRDSDL